MLYILPPPRTANPPSPWNSILCGGEGGSGGAEGRTWGSASHKRLPRVRLRELHFQKRENESASGQQDETDVARGGKSLSECYFAGKGAALVLPAAEAQKSNRRQEGQGNNIQKHLQSMFYLLRPEETLKMAVKLESVHPSRTRYLVVVSRMGRRAEESCLLGIDCNEKTTVGLVLRVLADTTITLDGDGGFSVSVCGRHHIFKPVSVQAMWSALQTLHKVSSKARTENYFQGGMTHGWVNYYEERIESDRSCLNEWHAMDNLESRRPPSPDSVRTKPTEREETERVIRSTLKEIMMSVDLDEVTSKYIRSRLEEELDMDLGEYKPFIDQEMLTILGQMDAPTEIFDHVYLGSEWNASNYEELQKNGVGHILNVTREIDNFFPGTFDYLNIRVYDDEKTDLLKHWDDTFKYINRARQDGSKVLVHCKMGVSRSASVVIAYAMKAYNWDFKTALQHVKEKRSCIKPNTSFLSQLETYQGILDAMKNKEKLQRSKSETNLKSPGAVAKSERVLVGSEPTPLVQALENSSNLLQSSLSGQDLRQLGARPKSWSPDNTDNSTEVAEDSKTSPLSVSLENLNKNELTLRLKKSSANVKEHVLLPCDNGESYSVSPNHIVHLPNEQNSSLVKERVSELEARRIEKKKLVLNLPTQFEKCESGLVKNEIWDPGEVDGRHSECNHDGTTSNVCDQKDSNSVCSGAETTVWTSSTVLQQTNSAVSSSSGCNQVPEQCTVRRKDGDPFSNQLDRVFDKEERKQRRLSAVPVELSSSEEIPRDCPSRQSSWSSYDSAVVLGDAREAPSRHSSWGSGDNRVLPSRNSSWGSYDMRPGAPIHYLNDKGEKVTFDGSSSGIFQYDKEDTPWYIGTVKRTKQKLEEGSAKKADNDWHSDCPNEVLSQSDNNVETFNTALIKCSSSSNAEEDKPTLLQALNDNLSSTSRLSVSAPETSAMDLITRDCASLSRSASNVSNICDSPSSSVVSTAQCYSVKQHKDFLESLNKEMTKSRKADDPEESSVSGIVRNLKKEFEAKNAGENIVKAKNRVNSLPTSPISIHQPKQEHDHQQPTSPTSSSENGEDLNLKKLIGKFESTNEKEQVVLRPKPFFSQNKNARYSCIEVSSSPKNSRLISNFAKDKDEFKRPPKPPSLRDPEPKVVVATVIAKASAKKQQQFGKSHPLARLNIKPRHTNPVYNTM